MHLPSNRPLPTLPANPPSSCIRIHTLPRIPPTSQFLGKGSIPHHNPYPSPFHSCTKHVHNLLLMHSAPTTPHSPPISRPRTSPPQSPSCQSPCPTSANRYPTSYYSRYLPHHPVTRFYPFRYPTLALHHLSLPHALSSPCIHLSHSP